MHRTDRGRHLLNARLVSLRIPKRFTIGYESAFGICQSASVPPDKMPHLKAILPEFAAKTRNETGNFFYEFTINGDEVFCREGYVNAEALLAHLENVGAMLAQALAMADLIRIEVHGPAAELAKLKEPLAH